MEQEAGRRRRERGETQARKLDGLGSHDIHRGEAEGGEGGDGSQSGVTWRGGRKQSRAGCTGTWSGARTLRNQERDVRYDDASCEMRGARSRGPRHGGQMQEKRCMQ